jgi:hypothetical protein
MPIIKTETDLREAILELEVKQVEEGKVLKEQFLLTYESFKPFNLFKSAFKDAGSSPFAIENILATAIGLGTGYLSKSIVLGASANIFKRFFGYVLQLGVTKAVAQHPDAVKSIDHFIFKHVFHKKEINPKSLDK